MRRIACFLAVSFALSGCFFFEIDRNIETLEHTSVIKGSLAAPLSEGHPGFVVLLRETDKKWERVSTRVFYAPAPFEFVTSPGKLRLFAFVDTAGDVEWNAKDPSTQAEVLNLGPDRELDVGELKPEAGGPKPPIAIAFDPQGSPQDLVEFHHGDIESLDCDRFTDDSAKLGLWQPVDFARKYGLGVSFLEPYDANKTPVLLIHGAAGSPKNFANLVAHLDREHFQPWFYSYPSGARLTRAVTNLGSIVDDLHKQLGFKKMIVVGYSMGGLIAHSFVMTRGERNYVRMLITVSSPYGGDETAQTGVEHLPIVPPFFIDLASNSDFLRSLRKPMPPGVPHIMLFSYGLSKPDKDNDGIVSLHSMLVREVQEQAAVVRGFPHTHQTMLAGEDVLIAVESAIAGTR